MNIITPKMGQTNARRRIQKTVNQNNRLSGQVSFKASPKALMSAADEQVLKVFSQHYGKAGNFLVDKADDLMRESKILERSSRFFVEKGNLAIKDKSIPRSLLESAVFPFTTLPLYGANWVLKKAQKIPAISKSARNLYNKPIFRNPRKLNYLNENTNQLNGILGKTRSTVDNFIKEKGVNISSQTLIEQLSKADDSPIVKEASDYVKENLYKVSNKFFDKNTGNFNTAYERPLNRIVTGLVPVAFLANDAYNLSVLCGDKKEDSTKEAKARTKQEISRVLTTAYIQLLTFGAFTKQVNNIPLFTPLTSGITVFFSEIKSRRRLGKPAFFISKEKAKEYHKKEAEKANKENSPISKGKKTDKFAVSSAKITVQDKPAQINNILTTDPTKSKIFESFKADSTTENKKTESKKEDKKPQERKALINTETFKKGVAILIAGGFALSFLKNSSFTKNSKIMQGFKKIGDFFKKKIYDPLAFKTFEMKPSEFDDLMKVLDEAGCKEIADGHRFIKNKYAAKGADVIKMQKYSLSSEGSKKAIEQISASLKDFGDDASKIVESVKTAISKEGEAISEMKFERVAKKATEIIQNKKINLTEEQLTSLNEVITDAVRSNSKSSFIKMDTKLKPFVDIVTQPFKFVLSAANLPFKLVKTAINLATGKIQKKAGEAALGLAELNKFESAINRAVVEVFGEKSEKTGKISQTIFANAMEKLQKETAPYIKARNALNEARKSGTVNAKVQAKYEKAKDELYKYVNRAVQKSFDGVTQSSNKNTDIAMMTKLVSSAVTSTFLVADNYNMVMIKSNGEDVEDAKEKANERIIQRLSALFYQSLFINWFNSTFKSTYNSSLKGMASVAIPNTLTTEILTRKSIGMPIGRKSYEQLVENEEKNENRKGFLGKYFKFMRLLTGKKPLKDRMPKNKTAAAAVNTPAAQEIKMQSTNLLERYTK